MSFDQNVFISYAHIDNQPLTAEQQGWITRFHASLQALLSMRMGCKAAIWRDDKLRGNDIFADEIVGQFQRTALLVSILTPRYLNSEWCTKEVREFCRVAEQTGGLVVENKSRVFKVLKTPVETQDSLPNAVKDALGYEFFTYEDGAPLELDPAYGDKFSQDYNRKVGKLAWDVAQLLKKLGGGGQSEGQAPAKATIYLAECSYDRRTARETLEADLKLHGHTVLPDRELPREEADYIAAVEGLLARCSLSIHLIGSSYGAVPDGPSQKSVVILQNELAARRCKNSALQRVIWLPEGTHSDQAPQQGFIEALHGDAEAQFGADLVTADLEQLKSSIHSALKKLEQPQAPAAPAGAGAAKLVYLICDEKDRKATVPVRKFLQEKGLEVAIPAFEGDAAAVREANQKLLTTCDAVILFYGAGDEAWKRTVDNELKKTKAYRGADSLLASYTYLSEPKTPDKEELIELEQPRLINALGGFAEAQMTALLQTLAPSGATR